MQNVLKDNQRVPVPPEGHLGHPLIQRGDKQWLRDIPILTRPLNPLIKSPISTLAGREGATKAATFTRSAVEQETTGLHKIFHGKNIWKRLLCYARISEKLSMLNNLNPPPVHMSDCPNVPNGPPPSYASGYAQMYQREILEDGRPQPPLINIESMQDIVNTMILDPINSFLQMRYENRAEQLSENHHYQDTRNNNVEPAQAANRVFYPGWYRSCKAHHINKGRDTAGYTDRLLFSTPAALNLKNPKYSQVSVTEGKPPWVYQTGDFSMILDGNFHLFDENDLFDTEQDSLSPATLFLQQIWGQLTDLGPDAGFATNGDVVVVFLRLRPQQVDEGEPVAAQFVDKLRSRTPEADNAEAERNDPNNPHWTADDSGLILSSLMSWTDADLRPCLAALSVLTLDEQEWLTLEGPDRKTIQQILCPAHESQRIRRAL